MQRPRNRQKDNNTERKSNAYHSWLTKLIYTHLHLPQTGSACHCRIGSSSYLVVSQRWSDPPKPVNTRELMSLLTAFSHHSAHVCVSSFNHKHNVQYALSGITVHNLYLLSITLMALAELGSPSSTSSSSTPPRPSWSCLSSSLSKAFLSFRLYLGLKPYVPSRTSIFGLLTNAWDWRKVRE